jgi:hypothetical protein
VDFRPRRKNRMATTPPQAIATPHGGDEGMLRVMTPARRTSGTATWLAAVREQPAIPTQYGEDIASLAGIKGLEQAMTASALSLYARASARRALLSRRRRPACRAQCGKSVTAATVVHRVMTPPCRHPLHPWAFEALVPRG